MHAWKSVAALFAFSMGAGLLGAACASEPKDTAAALEATDVEDEGTSADSTTAETSEPFRPDFSDRRCVDGCRLRYVSCGRVRAIDLRERERRCRRALDMCLVRCRR